MAERIFAINALWAKKSFKDGVMRWLPLTVHLKDSARYKLMKLSKHVTDKLFSGKL